MVLRRTAAPATRFARSTGDAIIVLPAAAGETSVSAAAAALVAGVAAVL